MSTRSGASTPRTRLNRPQVAPDGRADGNSTGHGKKAEAVRERAVVALLTEKSVGAAARRCQLGERTLRRWLTEDETFKRELGDARRATFQAGMNRAQALTSEAIETLSVLMARQMPPNVRLGAVRTIVELGMHQHDAEAILARLDELEEWQRRQAQEER